MISSKLNFERFGLSEKHWGLIVEILKKHPEVDRAVIFGSRAKSTHKTGSDVDLALEGDTLSSSVLLHVLSLLEESNLPYFFDVLDLNAATSDELRQHIKEYGITIYDRSENK